MTCNCDALIAKIASLEAKLNSLKPVDENAIIQKAIQGSTAAILPKIPDDNRIAKLAIGAVAGSFVSNEVFNSFKGNAVTRPEVNKLRTNFATKTEVNAVKAETDVQKALSSSLKQRQAEIAKEVAEKAAMNDLTTVEGRLRQQINEAEKIASDAKTTAGTALSETKVLGGKIERFFAQIGTEVEKIIAPLRIGLGKIQGVVDGLIGRITTILNELGVLSPLKRLIGLVGKLLWVIDVITAFISFDT